jgi:hypothetical protein
VFLEHRVISNGQVLQHYNTKDTINAHSKNVLYEVGFEVLTAASMKMAVFWVVAPCSLVEVYRRFKGACCLHHHKDLWNNGLLLPDNTALQPRRQPYSKDMNTAIINI